MTKREMKNGQHGGPGRLRFVPQEQDHRAPQEHDHRAPQEHDHRAPQERLLMVLEFGTAAAALGGGILLSIRPDGAFLHADPAVLRRTPFSTWRLPGLLLAAGCGGGYAIAALLHLRRCRMARLVSLAAGTALVGLEAWEIAFVEYQPLEVVFAGVGTAVAVLALCLPRQSRARETGTGLQ